MDKGPTYKPTGRTWVVKSGGSGSEGTEAAPLGSIGKALESAAAGDLILVHGGTYTEADLTIATDNLILTAATGETVTLKGSSKTGLRVSGSHVTVNGINLSGFQIGFDVGRDDVSQKDLVISNLRIDCPNEMDETGGIIDFVGSSFPSLDGMLVKNVTITGSVISVSCNVGLCKSWRFDDVRIVGSNGGGGFSASDGVAVENGDNILFYRTDISGCTSDGIDMKATRVVIWNSTVHNISRNAIKLWYGGDVVNTVVHHSGADAAIQVKTSPRFRFLHSVLAYHNYSSDTTYNMTVDYETNGSIQVEILNSIIYNTSGGSYFSGGSTLSIQNSIFYGMQNGTLLERGSATASTAAELATYGSGNLVQDPMVTADFHLKTGSPGINKGKALTTYYPATDAKGKPRVSGAGPDLGAFEDF